MGAAPRLAAACLAPGNLIDASGAQAWNRNALQATDEAGVFSTSENLDTQADTHGQIAQ
jgi:hypothetical protein